MPNVIAEYRVGKAVYWITPEGFVDNINPSIPGIEIVYPWHQIYATLEYEQRRNPRTGRTEPVLSWMRVYQKGGRALLAQIPITDDIRPQMIRFYELLKETQEKALNQAAQPAPDQDKP